MSQDFQDRLIQLLGHLDGESISDRGPTQPTDRYPLLPLRDQVIYPHVVTPLLIGRDRSVKAVESAFAERSYLVVVAQRDPLQDDPGFEDLYTVGTEVEIARVLRLPDGTTSALVQGHRRVVIEDLVEAEPYMLVHVSPLAEPEVSGPGVEALMRAVLALA
ncbi:MAG: LON peptidase substrate-binding domain-containing protein, partial [Anaerolineae bacterium]